jgi:exonuclease III
MAVSVCTINVNGIHEAAKRAKIFQSIREQNCDIAFVQETHISDRSEMLSWQREWGSRAFFSIGSPHARGVGILFKKHFNFDYLGLKRDSQGRFLSVLIEVSGYKLQLNRGLFLRSNLQQSYEPPAVIPTNLSQSYKARRVTSHAVI